jgi:O-antigen/teichoic acid export membrane protein
LNRFLRRIQLLLVLSIVPALLLLFVTAPFVVWLITGSYDEGTTALLRLSLPIPLLLGLNLPAYQALLATHKQAWYARVMVIGAITGVSLNLLLAPLYFETGTAISILAAEFVIVLGLLLGTEWKYPALKLWLPKPHTRK